MEYLVVITTSEMLGHGEYSVTTRRVKPVELLGTIAEFTENPYLSVTQVTVLAQRAEPVQTPSKH